MKRVCIIGGGFGGLALGIRLQTAGIATTLIEARGAPGGCAYTIEHGGFAFEAGPTAIADPAGLRELWTLAGGDMADDVELMPVSPATRVSWADGGHFNIVSDPAEARREVARLAPRDVAGYDDFVAYAAEVYADAYAGLGHAAFLRLRDTARAVPALARHQAWRSLHAKAGALVRSERLRQVLGLPALAMGGNPLSVSSLYALQSHMISMAGVWWARGGTTRLAEAMAGLFIRAGGDLRLGERACHIHTIGNRAHEVETQSGWRERFDAVASNADLIHTYRDLLGEVGQGMRRAQKLARKRWSPAIFAVHFALEGSWPGIPHHSVLMGPRYEGLLADIFEAGVLPRDQIIHLHHPTVTDGSLAPAGISLFTASIPVAHRGKLPIDWDAVAPLLEARIIAEIGLRLIPDIDDRILTRLTRTPKDHAEATGAHNGSAYSLEPTRLQSGWGRAHNRDGVIPNLYLVGAGTHPGAGIPGVIAGAKVTAGLMLDDLKR